MKTEKQMLEKLEEAITSMNALLEPLPDDPDKVSEDAKMQVCAAIASITALAWCLDCEDEMRKIIVGIKLAAAAGLVNAKMG